MSLSKSQRRNKIKLSIRKKINGSDVRPRVCYTRVISQFILK